jgi:hypothetical protein
MSAADSPVSPRLPSVANPPLANGGNSVRRPSFDSVSSRESESFTSRASIAVREFDIRESELPESNLPVSTVSDVDEELIHLGKLYKVSEHLRAWKPRFFVLEDNRLIHFLDPTVRLVGLGGFELNSVGF